METTKSPKTEPRIKFENNKFTCKVHTCKNGHFSEVVKDGNVKIKCSISILNSAGDMAF